MEVCVCGVLCVCVRVCVVRGMVRCECVRVRAMWRGSCMCVFVRCGWSVRECIWCMVRKCVQVSAMWRAVFGVRFV